jgi:hypothetical protein
MTGMFLHKAEARSREALIEAMGSALGEITSQDVKGFFGHCGYRVLGQSLMIAAVGPSARSLLSNAVK